MSAIDFLDKTELKKSIERMLDSARHNVGTMLPSEWAESKRVMTSEVSPFPGKYSYDKTPYLKEIVNCLSEDHPAQIIACMKGAQVGFSTGVIENGIGYIIDQAPGNILFLTGHGDLSEEAMNGKIDQMIDSCGLRPLIRPNVLRKRNQRTGDTSKSKEFPGGSLIADSASNHKVLRQRSVRYGFIDDFEAAKIASKESGSTTELIEQRFAAYAAKMKLFYISTPELKLTSNIEPVFLKGDQRKYHVPCPCCGDYIPLEWNIDLPDGNKAGITWSVDDFGKLVRRSVGYICQSCGGFFDDSLKSDMLADGLWKPTAVPFNDGYYSYHLSSLYAPPGMFDWTRYVSQYLEACPVGQEPIVRKYKTFVNVVLGQTYEDKGSEMNAKSLMMNQRNYQIGVIPEKLSIADGNGKIVMLTMAADMNGKVEDARLDWEIVAWSENGASYSVDQGSIGTFIPREGMLKVKKDRERWTYNRGVENSVWPVFTKIAEKVWVTDSGRKMKILITGLDTGHYTTYSYDYIDSVNVPVVGLKGKDVNKYVRIGADVPSFSPAKERNKLYLVEVNHLKDDLNESMSLRWDARFDTVQPSGYMNFPNSSDGKYSYQGYFSHFEAEHRVVQADKNGDGVTMRWLKKDSTVQNHFMDCRIYNVAVRDIAVWTICTQMKIKNPTWADYVSWALTVIR